MRHHILFMEVMKNKFRMNGKEVIEWEDFKKIWNGLKGGKNEMEYKQ